jgi:hypothetical protein
MNEKYNLDFNRQLICSRNARLETMVTLKRNPQLKKKNLKQNKKLQRARKPKCRLNRMSRREWWESWPLYRKFFQISEILY